MRSFLVLWVCLSLTACLPGDTIRNYSVSNLPIYDPVAGGEPPSNAPRFTMIRHRANGLPRRIETGFFYRQASGTEPFGAILNTVPLVAAKADTASLFADAPLYQIAPDHSTVLQFQRSEWFGADPFEELDFTLYDASTGSQLAVFNEHSFVPLLDQSLCGQVPSVQALIDMEKAQGNPFADDITWAALPPEDFAGKVIDWALTGAQEVRLIWEADIAHSDDPTLGFALERFAITLRLAPLRVRQCAASTAVTLERAEHPLAVNTSGDPALEISGTPVQRYNPTATSLADQLLATGPVSVFIQK